jgi:hypothetical protein
VLALGNVLLHGLHLVLITFSVTGWMLPQTRPWHLVLAALVFLSWFVVGPLLGRLGFCCLTGVQHAVWRRQGREVDNSYMSYLAERVTGKPPNAPRVECVTQIVFYVTTVLSLVLYASDRGLW